MNRFKYINSLLLSAMFILCGMFTACTSYDYDEEMNDRFKEEARLKTEDEKIKAEIIESIKRLTEELTQKIALMGNNVDQAIEDKDKQMIARFDKAADELTQFINQRSDQSGKTIEELGATLQASIDNKNGLFEKARLKAKQELQEAIQSGDEANIRKIEEALQIIARSEQATQDLADNYENRISQMLIMDERIQEMRIRIRDLEDQKVNMLNKAAAFETEMKKILETKINRFIWNDLSKIRDILSDYIKKLGPISDLYEWEETLERCSSEIESVKEELETFIGKVEEFSDMVDEAENASNDIEDMHSQMESLYEEATDLKEESLATVTDRLSDLENAFSELEDIKSSCEDAISEIENLMEEIKSHIEDAMQEAHSIN